jgi:hypothetical protein
MLVRFPSLRPAFVLPWPLAIFMGIMLFELAIVAGFILLIALGVKALVEYIQRRRYQRS